VKVLFLPAAEAEHLAQVAFYESKQTGLGARYLAEVTAALEYISEAPHRFRVVRQPALRQLDLKIFPFAIYFREVDGIVHVAAVAPHRRRPGYWQGRL
jgi:hypothetical protein